VTEAEEVASLGNEAEETRGEVEGSLIEAEDRMAHTEETTEMEASIVT
jgi:hypothetical protein